MPATRTKKQETYRELIAVAAVAVILLALGWSRIQAWRSAINATTASHLEQLARDPAMTDMPSGAVIRHVDHHPICNHGTASIQDAYLLPACAPQPAADFHRTDWLSRAG